MAAKALLVLSLSVLILLNYFSTLTLANDEDLSFLEEEDAAVPSSDPHPYDHTDFENYDDLEDDEALGDDYGSSIPAVDERDVVVLKDSNFSEFIERNRYVMVEFYAPWCGHCKALAPEYAAAATELKGEGVVLAKVDATEETQLANKYEIQGFPTVYFFIEGVHRDYPGQRSKDGIVTWVKKKIGPGIYNLTTVGEAEQVLMAGSKVVLGFLDSLVGSQADELAAASRLEDDLSFYQTASLEVAKLFHIDPQVKRPALVLLKKEAEMISHFDGQFTKSAIAKFVKKNKLPLVTTFTREVAPVIFENPIKLQFLLFATSNDSENLLPAFQEAAKGFKGKLIFIYVEMDNEDYGKSVSEYFGVSGDAPRVVAYTGNDDSRKFVLDGDLTLRSIKSFAEDFLEDKLKPFYKSDPIPEANDGDVKIVVGNNFDEIVLDESKDVLLEIYAPGCGHCEALEPIYNKLGKHLRGIDSLVIAKMDGISNEHPRATPDGYPTILFYPAGNKSFDPITFDSDRTVVTFYKFLKKHASIPFKLQKPSETPKTKDSEVTETRKSSSKDVKDEL